MTPDASSSSIGGLERDPVASRTVSQGILLPQGGWRLIHVKMTDRTDLHDSLVQEDEYLLHPTSPLQLQGNLFVLEDTLTQGGRILLNECPLPTSRPDPSPWDLKVVMSDSGHYLIEGWEDPRLNGWVQLTYEGGDLGRTRVLQDWQRSRRPATSGHRIPSALSNTWGDRSRDSRMNEAFLLKEIACAAEMGLQVVQLDDGWQSGITVNSAQAVEGGGHWEGFWNADPEFWVPHPTRFPRGLDPLVTEAARLGVDLGLWYAPDSWNDFSNWERDADCVLHLHRTYGVQHFKLDSINATTTTAFHRLRNFTSKVLEQSQGAVVFDLDITGDHPRPGYWGLVEVGPLFLENRYTDWGNYWPHHTLRNLWQLASWVDPLRLRIEWLNPHRNVENYHAHPLAPHQWPITTLAAITLGANPLGWCELQHLPQEDRDQLSTLLNVWKTYREEWAQGTILPLGECPCGSGISALASVSRDPSRLHLMLYRGRGNASSVMSAPIQTADAWKTRTLYGHGEALLTENGLRVEVASPLGFCWLILEPDDVTS